MDKTCRGPQGLKSETGREQAFAMQYAATHRKPPGTAAAAF